MQCLIWYLSVISVTCDHSLHCISIIQQPSLIHTSKPVNAEPKTHMSKLIYKPDKNVAVIIRHFISYFKRSISDKLVSVQCTICLCFHGKLAHRKDALFLQLLRRPNAQLVFRESSPHRTGLLRPQVFRYVATLLVELAEILLLRLVNDRQNASYRLPHHATACNNSI